MKELLKKQNGITLIALVITIIVLLILAGVSIAMITGENGIIGRANDAVGLTKYKTAEEKVNLAVIGAMADDGEMTVEELKTEVGYQGGTVSGTTFPVQVQMDGYTFTVEETGKVTANGSGGEEPPVEQGTLGTVTGTETTNTTVEDKLGNPVVVPAGFKVSNPTETVPDGIVIVDVSHEKTAGSEFVWIPVGNVKKADGTTVSIKLSRYTFDSKGKETDQGDKAILEREYNYQELETSDKGNAKDINAFKASVEKNKGYYIGRYEARDKDTTTARTSSTSDTNQLVCTPDDYVYNRVTQQQAADLSRNMYTDSNFTSDLVNSYAWDTAITFLQAFDNRADKTTPYSKQASLNKSLAEKGTNNLETKDVICNVYDMASNTREWTTENCSLIIHPYALRGGFYYHTTLYTSDRSDAIRTGDGADYAFRPLLYL